LLHTEESVQELSTYFLNWYKITLISPAWSSFIAVLAEYSTSIPQLTCSCLLEVRWLWSYPDLFIQSAGGRGQLRYRPDSDHWLVSQVMVRKKDLPHFLSRERTKLVQDYWRSCLYWPLLNIYICKNQIVEGECGLHLNYYFRDWMSAETTRASAYQSPNEWW
jgi:hypothetical protein